VERFDRQGESDRGACFADQFEQPGTKAVIVALTAELIEQLVQMLGDVRT
jgi:hypothetical protein